MANHDSNKITNENIDNVFSYHTPKESQPARYEAIRAAAKEFAKVVFANVPDCADRSTALRNIRESVMWANAAVALEP